MRGIRQAGLLALTVGLAGPARAECLGACADALAGALLAMLGYGVLGLVILIMLIRAKWRRGGVKLLIGSVVVAVGLPLISQAWQGWKVHRMESREIAGQPPQLDDKVVLILSDSVYACYYDACGLVLAGGGEAGAYALPVEALKGVDLAQPVSLEDLPLELWQPPKEGSSDPRSRVLTEAERKLAAQEIDYLILEAKPWFSDAPAPAEAALRQRPELEGVGPSERVNFALGPVSGGKLDLLGMKLDLLDLWLDGRPLALILAPYNTQDPGNAVAGHEAMLAAICSEAAVTQQWDCDYALR